MRCAFMLLLSLSLWSAETPPLTLPTAQVNPAVVAPVAAAEVPWATDDRILIVGDLLAAPNQPELAVRLQEALSPLGVRVRSLQNHRIGIEQWRTAALTEMAARPPQLVVILGGVGDVLAATADKKPAPTAEVWRKAVTEIAVAAQTAGAAVVIATPAIVGDKPSGGTGSAELDAYAEAARVVAAELKAEFCDLRAPLLAALTAKNAKGTRELGVLSKTPGQLKPEGMDLVAEALVRSVIAAVPRIPWTISIPSGAFSGSGQVEVKTNRITADQVSIFVTTDGSEPTEKSRSYTKPITVNATTDFRALAVAKNGSGKRSARGWQAATVKRVGDPAPAESLPGLWVDHFTLKKWRNPIAPLDSLKPDGETWWPNCELAAFTTILTHRWPDTSFALRFSGWFIAPLDGVYTFATYSDDASRLFIGDVAVVKNDELHPVRWDRGAIELTAGWHPFAVHYAQGPQALSLEVHVSLPGQRLAPLPDLLLRRPVVKPPRKNSITAETADESEPTPPAPAPAKP